MDGLFWRLGVRARHEAEAEGEERFEERRKGAVSWTAAPWQEKGKRSGTVEQRLHARLVFG